MTLVGVVLLVAMIVVLVFWRRHFIWYLSAMIPFPQTAMLVVAGQGISPFWAAAIVASLLGLGSVVRSVIKNRGRFTPFRGPETALLATFATWATFITLTGPHLFEGIGVISPRLGINDQLAAQTPLTFTISNFAQLAYMLLGVGVVIYVMSIRDLSPRILEAGIWVGVIFTAVNAAFLTAGIAFPRELFDTIPTIYYQGGGRLRGPFAEPSVLGAFLVASGAYLFTRLIRARGVGRLPPVVGLALVGWEFYLSTSGTVFVAGVIVAAVAGIVFLARWVQHGLRHMQVIVLATIGGSVVLVWQSARLFGFINELVAEKLVSDSLADRSGADEHAYRIFLETFGVGVGLGSNRPSGFIAMMLSCVGIIGTVLFASLVISAAFRTMRHAPMYSGAAWALIGVVTAMSIAKADLPTPMLWMGLAVCMSAVVTRTASVSGDVRYRRPARLNV